MSPSRTARLITPQGKILPLPPDVYEATLQMLEEEQTASRRSRAEMLALIEETRGKYTDGPSLIEALLAERAVEREQEAKRDRQRSKRFFSE